MRQCHMYRLMLYCNGEDDDDDDRKKDATFGTYFFT